jgi:hypothetical protein
MKGGKMPKQGLLIPSHPHPAYGYRLPPREGLGVTGQTQQKDGHANLLMLRCLVFLLLLFPSWAVRAWGERGTVQTESTATQNETATETTSPSLFGTPSVGYVFEPEAQALRPILGTPGAAFFGSKVDLGMSVRRAWVSPRQTFVLAEAEPSPEVLLLDLQGGTQTSRTLPTLAAGAERVAVSPTGSAMAFYFRDGNRLQIASGLPASPEVGPGIDLAGMPGLLSSLAVSDDGRAALVAVTDGGMGAVYLITSEEKRIIAQAGDVRAMTFLTSSLSAVIADTTANEVRLLDDVMGTAASQLLAEESRGVSHPLALQVSADNGRVFVLNSGAQAITTVDLTTGLLSHLPINGSASRMQRLGGDVFQLTDDFRQSTLLFDATSPEARIVFVPQAVSERSSARSASRDRAPDARRPLPLH